jgi:hypothetical protein
MTARQWHSVLLILTAVVAVSGNRWQPRSSFIQKKVMDPKPSIELTSLTKTDEDDESESLVDDRESLIKVRGGADAQEAKASTLSSVFNLVNNVAGAGILTLSAGMAPGTGWIPAILICAVLGILSGHTFAIIGEACELTGEGDFKVCWSYCFFRLRAKFLTE